MHFGDAEKIEKARMLNDALWCYPNLWVHVYLRTLFMRGIGRIVNENSKL